METFSLLLAGISTAIEPSILFSTILGAILGLLIGALPGLGPTAGVAIMLPVAAGLGGVAAIACLGGVYYGAMFGGAITSILLGIPGDAPAVMTVIDGYPMAQKGEAGRALGMSVFASFIGGIFGVTGLVLLASPVARMALAFGPTEMTAIMCFALSLLSVLGGRNIIKGFVALGIGFWLGCVGLDPIAGVTRFTFGTSNLFDGFDFAIIAVGLFGLTAIFTTLEVSVDKPVAKYSLRSLMPRLPDAIVSRWQLLIGSVIGFFVGVLPGVGGTAATMLSYGFAKRTSSTPELYGTGIVQGVAAPESANNSASYASMIPLFSLGIPGSATTAVLMGGLLMVGLQPGPLLFVEQPEFVWSVFGSFVVGNISLVFLTLLLTPLLASALYVPIAYLYPIVISIVVYGVFAIDYSMYNVMVAIIAGVVGLILQKLDYPAVPLILGLVLGPLLERNIRRTLIQSQGDLSVFIERPIALFFFLATLLVLLLPLILNLLKRRKINQSQETSNAASITK